MASFVTPISPPAILASENNARPRYKFNLKPFYSSKRFHTITTIESRKPYSPHIAIARSYKTAPSISYADEEDSVTEAEYQALRDGLRAESMPKHVAVFMDGHRRDMPPELSYDAGRRTVKDIARICREVGIKVLSVAFSSENFWRSNEEVDFAMKIIEATLKSDLEELARNGIRVSIIGNRNSIPKALLETITQAEETTKNNKTLHVIVVVDYTGRYDIIQACTTLAEKVNDGLMQPEDIDENVIQQELQTKCLEFPNPDLMIRTSDKYCVDNFMLWQLAYAEFFFAEKHASKFKKADFIKALHTFQKRQRRIGK